MNAHGRWDEQLIRIERALVEITSEAANQPDQGITKTTIDNRDAIDRALASITVEQNTILLAEKRAKSLNRANSSITWWAKQLVGKLKILSNEYVALQNRKMWLRLLQARFTSNKNGASLDLQAKHLVDLAIRKKQLEVIEEGLQSELELLNIERARLKNEHAAIQTADQNWDASGSFQARLGTDFSHAQDNPSSKALSDYFNLISVPSVHPEEDGWLRKSNDELRKKSGQLAEQCRELAAAIALENGPASKLSTTYFRNTLAQVSLLNDQVVRRFAAIKTREKPKSRLKLVQKT